MFWAGLDEGWGKFQVAKVRGADFRSNGNWLGPTREEINEACQVRDPEEAHSGAIARRFMVPLQINEGCPVFLPAGRRGRPLFL
jgi:hypothetical protein